MTKFLEDHVEYLSLLSLLDMLRASNIGNKESVKEIFSTRMWSPPISLPFSREIDQQQHLQLSKAQVGQLTYLDSAEQVENIVPMEDFEKINKGILLALDGERVKEEPDYSFCSQESIINIKVRIAMGIFYFTTLILSFICLKVYSQEYKANVIQLKLENQAYKELQIRIQGGARNGANYDVRFAGSLDEKRWNFTYPDSLYAESYSFTFDIPTYNDTISRTIGFKYINNNDTLSATTVAFSNCDTTLIDATFLQTDTLSDVLTRDKNGNPSLKDVFIDYYLLTSHQDKELLSSIGATRSKFYWFNVNSSQYATEVEKSILI